MRSMKVIAVPADTVQRVWDAGEDAGGPLLLEESRDDVPAKQHRTHIHTQTRALLQARPLQFRTLCQQKIKSSGNIFNVHTFKKSI